MPQKIEGTLLLEGLIEGPLPPFPDALDRLEKWAANHRRLHMTVQSDAGRFSALPGVEPIAVEAAGGEAGDASNAIADALAELLGLFPPLEKSQVFSTLRSTEWQPKLEIKTLYAVGPNGRPALHQERSAAPTIPPAQPLKPREMLVRAGFGLLIAVALIGISALFIDYRKAFHRLTATSESVNVMVNENNFAPYVHLAVNAINQKNGTLEVQITRTDLYPLTDSAIDALYEHPPLPPAQTQPATTAATTPATAPTMVPAARTAPALLPSAPGLVRRRLAIEALARGTIHVEFRDAEGNFTGEAAVRTGALQHASEIDTTIPIPTTSDELQIPATLTLRP